MSKPVALITGAGRGIGRATAIELGGRGYRLVLVSRTLSQLDQTLSLAGEGVCVAADVSQADDVERAMNGALDAYGRVDATVNCAGVAPMLSILETTPQRWREIIDTNLSSAFYLMRSAWPAFVRQGGGVAVNVSSLAARDPLSGLSAYGAAKAGVNLLGWSLAREGAAHNIRVHTVAPGAVETEMFRKIVSPEQWGPEKTMEPAAIARVIAGCVLGDLRYSSGEVIYLSKTL